ADREPPAEALGHRDGVGAHAPADLGVVVGHPVSGAPHPGLDFVQDEQGAVLIGEPAGSGEVAGRQGPYADLALDRFDHEGGHLVPCRAGEGLLQGLDIAEREVFHAAGQGFERFAVGLFGGQCQGAHGAAVEGALEGEDPGPVAAAVPAGEFEGRLHGFGARIGQEHPRRLGCGAVGGHLGEPFGQADLDRGGEEIGDVPQGAQLRRDGPGQGGVGMPEAVHRDAAEQVEVALSVGVPYVHAFATHEDALRRAEGVHQRMGVALGPLPLAEAVVQAGDHFAHGVLLPDVPAGAGCGSVLPPSGVGSTMVPTPSVVKISNSNECGRRPSITWACHTPPVTARKQASIFGTMPEARVGSRSARWAASICRIRELRSGQLAYRPSTSVSTTSFWAPRAVARAAAAVSALTLSTSPGWSMSGAMVEMTGMRPASSRSRTARGLTPTTSPTRPTSTSLPSMTAPRLRASNSPAS